MLHPVRIRLLSLQLPCCLHSFCLYSHCSENWTPLAAVTKKRPEDQAGIQRAKKRPEDQAGIQRVKKRPEDQAGIQRVKKRPEDQAGIQRVKKAEEKLDIHSNMIRDILDSRM